MRSGIALGFVVLFSLSPLSLADEGTRAKDVVLGMINAVEQRDFDALDAFVAADVRRHSGATPGVNVTTLDEFKAFLAQDLATFPDAHQEINFIFESDGMVAVHATYIGTQTGSMGPFPPSGKKMELPFIGLLRVEDGKIAEMWVEWDNLNALTQLGHLPPPTESGSAPKP